MVTFSMNTYYVEKAEHPLNWAKIPALDVNNILWLPDAGIRMTQQICYDDSALYVHQQAIEKHIRAENHDLLDQACEDSCMEFFFCPDPCDERYFNFEITPNGFMYLGLCKNRTDFIRLFPEDPKETFCITPTYSDNGWELSYMIPLSFIRTFFPTFTLKPGVKIRANCYKCGDLTKQPHYLSWNPCSQTEPNFHVPQDFGTLILL